MNPLFDPEKTPFDLEQPVFIVGGGASLREFDFTRLKRRNVIALNLAYRVVPWANVLFFGDNRFWEDNKDTGGEHFWRFGKGRILTTASYCGGMNGRVTYVPPSDFAVEMDGKLVSPAATATGAQAILLAHALGAKKIVLLGFDNKPGHWASEKPYRHGSTPTATAFDAYATDFERIAALGLDIVNANPRTALEAFPTADLADLL